MAERAPLGAPAAPDDQGERRTIALLTVLARAGPECEVWSEQLNGRWVCLLTYRDQTYCLLPLHYPPVGAGGDA